MTRIHRLIAPTLCAVVVSALGANQSQAAERKIQRGEDRLLLTYPGLRVHRESMGAVAYFGRAMNSAPNSDAAAQDWLGGNGGAFDVTKPDLRLRYRAPVGSGVTTVYSYQQYVDGLPVEYGQANLVVRGGAQNASVIYASARLVNKPEGGFRPITVNAADAVAKVQGMSQYRHLSDWSAPSMVVYPGESDPPPTPIRAWKFTGATTNTPDFDAYTFFVDVSSGDLAYARREVYFHDVQGQVTGMGSPGVLPDEPSNPSAALNLPNLQVNGPHNGTALTDADGNFTLTNAGVGSVDLSADLSGPWVQVLDQQGPNLHVDQTVAAQDDANMLFNDTPSEFTTAQVNAFVHVNTAHDFYKKYQPSFTAIDQQMPTRVNVNLTCNAFFSPSDLSFNFEKAGGCVNTAYSSVITHEYGHFVVNRLNLRQQAFGEGFGDCMSILIFNDHVIGRDFLQGGVAVRDVEAADQQYPCKGEVHECGQVLGGSWWDIKKALAATLGEDAGLEAARQLFTDWSQITIGIPFGQNSATPKTAIEVLTADDDDGDLSNGTPHESEICAGFARHSIPCPGVCEDVQRIQLSCRSHSGRIRATAVTSDPDGTEIGFTLDDGAASQSATANSRGRATVTFDSVSFTFHKVCIDGCPGVCRTVGCPP